MIQHFAGSGASASWRVTMRPPGAWSAAVLGLALVLPASASAQTLLTQQEALELAFPGSAVERRTAFLSEADLERVRGLAGEGVDVDQGVVTYYVGHQDGAPIGFAYFDAHRVRTMAEVVMIVVEPEGRVRQIEVLKFMEPGEYRAPAGWIAQLEGRSLDDDLSTRGAIRNLTGATLTARALLAAARRVLALHMVIDPVPQAAP